MKVMKNGSYSHQSPNNNRNLCQRQQVLSSDDVNNDRSSFCRSTLPFPIARTMTSFNTKVKMKFEEFKRFEIETKTHDLSMQLKLRFECKYCRKSFLKAQHLIFHKKHRHPQEACRDQIKNRNRLNLINRGFGGKWLVSEAEAGTSRNGKPAASSESDSDADSDLSSDSDSESKTEPSSEANKKTIKVEADYVDFQELRCRFCNKLCFCKSNLIDHENMHMGIRPYSCKHCLAAFTWRDYHKLHERRCQGKGRRKNQFLSGKRSSLQQQKSPKAVQNQNMLQPRAANRMSIPRIKIEKNAKSLKTKASKVSQKQQEIPNKTMAHKELQHLTPVSVDSKLMYRCEFCTKVIYNRYVAVAHVRTHTGSKPYNCSTCGKGFSKNSYLNSHEKKNNHGNSMHAVLKEVRKKPLASTSFNFACQLCPQVFAETKDFLAHKKQYHSRNMIAIIKQEPPDVEEPDPDEPDPDEPDYDELDLDKRDLDWEPKSKAKPVPKLNLKLKSTSSGRLIVDKVQPKLNMKPASKVNSLSCRFCAKRFYTQYYLGQHEKIVHLSQQSFQCQYCSKLFKWKHYCKLHEYKCQRENPRKVVHSNGGAKKQSASKSEPRKSRVRTKAQTHLESHDQTESRRGFESTKSRSNVTVNADVDGSNLIAPIEVNGKVRYKCKDCGKLIRGKDAALSHAHMHTGYRPYECSKCTKSFTMKTSLDRHQRFKHSEPVDALKTKVRVKTEVVIKSEPLSESEMELQSERNETPFTSKRRSKSDDNSKSKGKKRIRNGTARAGAGSKSYYNSNSDSEYESQTSKSSFDSMQGTRKQILNSLTVTKSSNGFKCTVCSKVVLLKQNYLRHLLIHTDQKLFKCSCCEKRFTSESSRLDHESAHWGIMRHSCRYCEQKFTWRSYKDVHQRSCELRPV